MVVVLSVLPKLFLSPPLTEPAWRLTGFPASPSSSHPAHHHFLSLQLVVKTERAAFLGGNQARNLVLHPLSERARLAIGWAARLSSASPSFLPPSLGGAVDEGRGLGRACGALLPPPYPPLPVRSGFACLVSVRVFPGPPPTPPDRTPLSSPLSCHHER